MSIPAGARGPVGGLQVFARAWRRRAAARLARVGSRRRVVLALIAVGVLVSVGRFARTGPPSTNRLAYEILAELVRIDTSSATGSATLAAEAAASRLLRAGFPPADVRIVGPGGRKQNLVARYRGTGRREPLLLLAHSDVVDARRQDWSLDPFQLVERGGFLYGRGTTDMKDMAAAFLANLLVLREEGYRPDRDIVFALTADEEGGEANGVEWLLRNEPGSVRAALCLTEGGGGQIHEGRYAVYTVQTAEKASVTFALEARGPGGHSAVPSRDNAIARVSAAVARIAGYEFPVSLNDLTRSFFARMAAVEEGSLGRDLSVLAAGAGPDADAARRLSRLPYYNALLRTTCAPTGIEGGGAQNALPQNARAVVNCRLLPDAAAADVERALRGAVADPQVAVTVVDRTDPSPASPWKGEAFVAVEAVAREMWPGVPVVPAMGTGTTDGRLLRRAGIPAYGIGAFRDIEDNRAHGPDERIGVRQFYEEREFVYRLIKKLTN